MNRTNCIQQSGKVTSMKQKLFILCVDNMDFVDLSFFFHDHCYLLTYISSLIHPYINSLAIKSTEKISNWNIIMNENTVDTNSSTLLLSAASASENWWSSCNVTNFQTTCSFIHKDPKSLVTLLTQVADQCQWCSHYKLHLGTSSVLITNRCLVPVAMKGLIKKCFEPVLSWEQLCTSMHM